MYRTTTRTNANLRKRARREINRAISNAGSTGLRDELIIIAQRSGLI